MSENKKTKILLIGDHPFAPSGVGTQLKYIIECLLKTGKYKFTCLGGAVKHDNYQPSQVPSQNGEWELGDWVIHPVDGYGNQELIRSAIWMDRPDMLMFMTDPRFYSWLWEMENEIRTQVPMVYYHVWDNYPYPKYNKKWYTSNDVIASISKVTYDIVNNVSPEVENHYIPHAVNSDIFKKLNEKDILEFKKESIGEENSNKFVFMWNNRNARRKQSGTLLFWFNEFAEEVGPENVCLIMHTDPTDPHGQPLEHIIKEHSATDGRIILSKNKPLKTVAHLVSAYSSYQSVCPRYFGSSGSRLSPRYWASKYCIITELSAKITSSSFRKGIFPKGLIARYLSAILIGKTSSNS